MMRCSSGDDRISAYVALNSCRVITVVDLRIDSEREIAIKVHGQEVERKLRTPMFSARRRRATPHVHF